MAKKVDDVMATLPAKRRAKIVRRTQELASLKDLRQAVEQTQEDLASALGVGQDSISRLEQRSDMLLSTLPLRREHGRHVGTRCPVSESSSRGDRPSWRRRGQRTWGKGEANDSRAGCCGLT